MTTDMNNFEIYDGTSWNVATKDMLQSGDIIRSEGQSPQIVLAASIESGTARMNIRAWLKLLFVKCDVAAFENVKALNFTVCRQGQPTLVVTPHDSTGNFLMGVPPRFAEAFEAVQGALLTLYPKAAAGVYVCSEADLAAAPLDGRFLIWTA